MIDKLATTYEYIKVAAFNPEVATVGSSGPPIGGSQER